ncbi:MAG: Eco57I restriction-modification methylase domain-containing protein [Verrucomicrobia bacterium]|nr:Eco57I restriction-modification methylase domain-containing protein [Verrucomicrobiota bacterium]
MSRPERQQNVLELLKGLRGIEPLKQLFWSELNYQRVNQPLSRRGWTESVSKALADDPVLFAGGGENNDFHVIYARLASDKLLLGGERPVVSRLLNEHPYTLFVFSNAAQNRWHFLNVKYDETSDKRRLFRRITVGPEQRLRTASERISLLSLESFGLAPLTIQQHHDEAFDKEALTDEFFRKLDKHIRAVEEDLKEHHKLDGQDAFGEAQLLIERLIFLYFAQNRGWLNQDSEYLIKNFAEHRGKPSAFTYYADSLHRLFKSLAEQSFGNRLPGVPFLNGGLFDDDEFKPESSKLRIRNATFANLFDQLLEIYNFTVREDTPLDQEVAVDPEMLGKIFESIVLHRESAGTEYQAPNLRKATGSNYTPRIVVHFICREALRLYFAGRAEQLADPGTKHTWSARVTRLFKEIEPDDGFSEHELKTLREVLSPTEARRSIEILKSLRTLDPSVGSGAFPVGLLHEMVSLLRIFETVAGGYQDPVKGEGSTWKQKAKEHFIQHSLFGVDIQQQAIEICRLRLWLSLLVDYELGVNPFEAERSKFIEAINHISQLPNLEMNFRRGDSLHDYICGHPVRLDGTQLTDYTDDLARIEKSGQELHQAKRAERKKRLRLEILAQRLDLGKRIVTDQIRALQTNQQVGDLFGLTGSDAATQRRVDAEIARLRDAHKQLEKDEKEFQRVQAKPLDKNFYRNLRKLEGAEPDGPHNFVWRLDFPHVLAEKDKGTVLDNLALVNEAGQGELVKAKSKSAAGFDLIVGNPPFVNVRSKAKVELYRERWPAVCVGDYQMVCPFFTLGFGLLRPSGQLGFIVSNAFLKREFGKPLVEDYFETVHVQKIVDCSGLMFPGHGTPTCIVYGRQVSSPQDADWMRLPVRVVAILPSGGDLRTTPEESPLWHTIESQQEPIPIQELNNAEQTVGFRKLFEDTRIAVGDCDRKRMLRHPALLSFYDWPTLDVLNRSDSDPLRDTLGDDVGFMFILGRNDIFMSTADHVRRQEIPPASLKRLNVGDEVRDWQLCGDAFLIFPYDQSSIRLLELSNTSPMGKYFELFSEELSNRPTFKGSFKEAGRKPYQFHQMPVERAKNPKSIALSQISTHGHFVVDFDGCAFNEKAPLVKLPAKAEPGDYHLLASELNSSTALFWLKHECFSKRESEDGDKDTYFEFAGKKLQRLPLARSIADALRGKPNALAERLTALSRACWERGRVLPSLALRKLFEKSGEAYHAWNAALPGHVAPHAKLAAAFATTPELQERFARAVSLREQLGAGMVARQEEMDWLVYAAYGLLLADHSAAQVEAEPAPLNQAQRPFRLWESTGGDFDKAITLIPADWPKPRRTLWEARLAAIRDNEHIRRIEQPVYKRRWDEQWKVSNRWMAGPVAYAQEFVDAFRWWLAEKAEWLLEHKADGGPVELGGWTPALWKDKRIQAAWPVVADAVHQVRQFKFDASENESKKLLALDASYESFSKFLKETVADETVPAGIPPAVSWEELEKKQKIPAKVRAIRGKLNVPRERFNLTSTGKFVWAGRNA